MYSIDEIKKLKDKAIKLELYGHELLKSYSDEELQKICNGIGADFFPEKLRSIITSINPSFEASALIHDLMYHIDYGFEQANDLLELNGKIEAKSTYSWYNPLRYFAIRRAKIFANLCRKFGQDAYDQNSR